MRPDSPIPPGLTIVSVVMLIFSLIAIFYIHSVSLSILNITSFARSVPLHTLSRPLVFVGRLLGDYWFIFAIVLIVSHAKWVRISALRQFWFNALYAVIVLAAISLWSYTYVAQQRITMDAMRSR